jgi:hypothetical protein
MTTMSHPASPPAPIVTQREFSATLARPGFFARLKKTFARLEGVLEKWRSAEEEREFTRFSGCRWTDSIERQMNDAISTAGRRPDCFEK